MIRITPNSIKRIKYHRYLTGNSKYAKDYNSLIQKCIKALLYYSAKDYSNGEVVFIINNNTFKVFKESQSNPNNVNISMYEDMLLKSSDTFTIIHNHNTENGFSVTDLNTFLSVSSLTVSIVVENSGRKIYIMAKDNSYKLRLKLLGALAQAIERINSSIRIEAKTYIEKLKVFGIEYNEYYN